MQRGDEPLHDGAIRSPFAIRFRRRARTRKHEDETRHENRSEPERQRLERLREDEENRYANGSGRVGGERGAMIDGDSCGAID